MVQGISGNGPLQNYNSNNSDPLSAVTAAQQTFDTAMQSAGSDPTKIKAAADALLTSLTAALSNYQGRNQAQVQNDFDGIQQAVGMLDQYPGSASVIAGELKTTSLPSLITSMSPNGVSRSLYATASAASPLADVQAAQQAYSDAITKAAGDPAKILAATQVLVQDLTNALNGYAGSGAGKANNDLGGIQGAMEEMESYPGSSVKFASEIQQYSLPSLIADLSSASRGKSRH